MRSMVVDAKEFQLQPGQALLIKPYETHQIFNDGQDNLEFLMVSAPAWTAYDGLFRSYDALFHEKVLPIALPFGLFPQLQWKVRFFYSYGGNRKWKIS